MFLGPEFDAEVEKQRALSKELESRQDKKKFNIITLDFNSNNNNEGQFKARISLPYLRKPKNI
jgi:hypothetical protein